MVTTCCVCKKESNPHDNGRTFHRFPKSEELKAKWCKAVGFEKVPKNGVVCSDHFHKTDYRDLCDRPLLRPDAVPHKPSSDTENTLRNGRSENHEDCEAASTEVNTSACEVPVDNAENIDSKYQNSSECSTSIIDQNTCDSTTTKLQKRKLNETDAELKKRLCVAEFGVVRKEDFTSTDAWSRCVEYITRIKQQLKNALRQNNRLKNKVNTLNDLLFTLKEEKLLTDNAMETLEVSIEK